MLWILIEKELKAVLQSPKFAATLGVCSVLILLSVFIGILEFRTSVAEYETATQLADQQIVDATSYFRLSHNVYRKPSPMQIFVSGVTYDVGRLSTISTYTDVKLVQSSYSNKPLFAVFRFIDFAFIVQVVLSLFAIFFTYDAVNGERENGTLKLALSNAVPRGKYLFAKFVGSWLGLAVPLLIPMLLGLLLLLVFRVPMNNLEWMKLISLMGASILYFTCFITLGLLVSSLTRRSSVSFLILLVFWICLVLIVPRGATLAAGQLVDVPTVADVESRKDRYRMDRYEQWTDKWRKVYEERFAPAENMSREDRIKYYEENRPKWQQEDDEMREQVDVDIAEFNRKLNEILRNAKAAQEKLAFTLSRLSPASAYKLMAMNLGGTNTSVKKRYEDAMISYRESFTVYVKQKRIEEREKRVRERRATSPFGTEAEKLDSSDMPRFTPPEETITDVARPSIIDFGLLSVFSVLAFAGAFVAFIRYDVR